MKAVNLFKMPSSDPFTTVAVLRTMAEIDPAHTVVRVDVSGILERTGTTAVERTLYRPQYFDKIVAWGGGDAINNVIGYLGPGIQLISFDPKSSISMIGREVFDSEDRVDDVAERLAADTTVFNQEACLASRYDVRGRRTAPGGIAVRQGGAAAELRPRLRVGTGPAAAGGNSRRGRGDGGDGRSADLGCVRRSRPGDSFGLAGGVSAHQQDLERRVWSDSLDDAVRYVNVATQTIGVYPDERKAQLRDRLASAGAQRLCRLGTANAHVLGSPHDAMYPLQRFVHWMGDDDITAPGL